MFWCLFHISQNQDLRERLPNRKEPKPAKQGMLCGIDTSLVTRCKRYKVFHCCAPCLNVDSQWCQFSSSLVFGIHSIYLFGAAKGLLKQRNQAGSEQVLWTSVKSCEVTRLPGWRQQKFWFAGWGHTRSHRGLLCLEKMWTTKASSFFRKKLWAVIRFCHITSLQFISSFTLPKWLSLSCDQQCLFWHRQARTQRPLGQNTT